MEQEKSTINLQEELIALQKKHGGVFIDETSFWIPLSTASKKRSYGITIHSICDGVKGKIIQKNTLLTQDQHTEVIDATTLATTIIGQEQHVNIWSLESKGRLRHIVLQAPASNMSPDKKGQFLTIVDANGNRYIWSKSTNTVTTNK